MSDWDCYPVDDGYLRRKREREAAEQARTKAAADQAAAAYRRDEEPACFRLIRSTVASERVEGYRRHIVFLATKHRITITYGPVDAAASNLTRRSITIPRIDSEDAAAIAYHELSHILCGRCPQDGIVHKRNTNSRTSFSCNACENDATDRALRLAPFSRSMHELLGLCLWTYSLNPQAPAGEVRRYKQINGTISYAEHREGWRKWFERVDRNARARAGVRTS